MFRSRELSTEFLTFESVFRRWAAELQDQATQLGEPRGSNRPFSPVTATDANAARLPAALDSDAGTSR